MVFIISNSSITLHLENQEGLSMLSPSKLHVIISRSFRPLWSCQNYVHCQLHQCSITYMSTPKKVFVDQQLLLMIQILKNTSEYTTCSHIADHFPAINIIYIYKYLTEMFYICHWDRASDSLGIQRSPLVSW